MEKAEKLSSQWEDAYRATQIAGLLLIVIPILNLSKVYSDLMALYISLVYGGFGILFLLLSKKIKNHNEKILTLLTYIWGVMIVDSLFSLLTTKNIYSLLAITARIIIFVYLLTPNKKIQDEMIKLKEKKVKIEKF